MMKKPQTSAENPKTAAQSSAQSPSEASIFEKLKALAHEPGYIHALARIALRDNMITHEGQAKPEDMLKLYKPEKLLRNELNACLGLWAQGPRDFGPIDKAAAEHCIERTRSLLEEIHEAMVAPIAASMRAMFEGGAVDEAPLGGGASMREAIFYGGESAYPFQYRDFAPSRYKADEEWIVKEKGFSMAQAADVARALSRRIDRRVSEEANRTRGDLEACDSPLDLFTFTASEVALAAKTPVEICGRVLDAFACAENERNADFDRVDARNMAAILPIMRRQDRFVLFNAVDLFEALYQAPYFWMLGDKPYRPTASKNRGDFTEEFAHARLAAVFGASRTFLNVKFMRSKDIAGEADVVVVFSKLAIVVQAKSKQLTAAARQGNEQQIRSDFAAAVQDACDQGLDCASLMFDAGVQWVGPDGRPIARPDIQQVFPLCLVADHYPALAAQARQFLKFQPRESVAAPLVMDVFLLDAMAEMLESPLLFLDFLSRRCEHADALMASHELNILGCYLSHNLWVGGEADLVHLWDDFGIDLELSMMARRDGLDAPWTPPGILALIEKTTLGKLVKSIGRRPDLGLVDLGLAILDMNQETFEQASAAIDEMARRSRADGMPHDFTMQPARGVGLTFHSSPWPEADARDYLTAHCARRKYVQRARKWFGVVVDPANGSMRFGSMLDFPWVEDPWMSQDTAHMLRSSNVTRSDYRAFARGTKSAKVGRNDPCPCGSGKKSKRCCG